jgi:NADH:ubiquinone oxidoreductase subunit K
MLDGESILLLSGFLFTIGIIGILNQTDIIKVFISIEIMIFAGIVNFCYFSGNTSIRSGHFAILIGVILGGLVLSVIFSILNLQIKDKRTGDLLEEDSEEIADD